MISLNREPAVFVALAAALITVVSDFFVPMSAEQIGVLNALVVAIAGLVTAIWVTHDKLAPAILGLAQAVIALAVAFGLGWDAAEQGALLALVTTLVGMFVRTQSTAPVNHLGDRIA